MSNLTDALIAAKLVGGSGGSGGGSGLPEIRDEGTELLNRTLTFFDPGMGKYMSDVDVDFSLSVGSVYTVKWDNVDYTCTAVEIDGGGGVMATVIGNVSIMGLTPDTGEPFMAFMPQTGELDFYTTSTSASHDVVISGMAQIPADGSIVQVVNGAWQPVVPPSGGTEVLPFIVRFSLKIDQTITKYSSSTVTLDFFTNNLPDTWNTAAGLSCYIKSGNTIYGLVLLKVELDLPTKKAVATILNPLASDRTIGSGDEMYGYAIKLT